MPNTPEEIAVLVSLGLPAFKYKKGDLVWYIQSTTTTKQLDCPDCLGSRLWKVTTPAGTAMTMTCQRCSDRMHHDIKLPSLKYHVAVYDVRHLTIGQLNNYSHNREGRDRSYMCIETGIGSGSVYNEDMLYEDEHVARDIARIKTEEAAAKALEMPQMMQTMHFSGISIDRASWMASFSQIYDGWIRAREYYKALEDMTKIGGDKSHECERGWTSKFSEEDIESIEDLISDKYQYSSLEKYHKDRNAMELVMRLVESMLKDPAELDMKLLQKVRDMFPALPPPKLSL